MGNRERMHNGRDANQRGERQRGEEKRHWQKRYRNILFQPRGAIVLEERKIKGNQDNESDI